MGGEFPLWSMFSMAAEGREPGPVLRGAAGAAAPGPQHPRGPLPGTLRKAAHDQEFVVRPFFFRSQQQRIEPGLAYVQVVEAHACFFRCRRPSLHQTQSLIVARQSPIAAADAAVAATKVSTQVGLSSGSGKECFVPFRSNLVRLYHRIRMDFEIFCPSHSGQKFAVEP